MTDATSSTRVVPISSSDPDVTSGVAQFLAPVVIDLTALAVDGKQAHWHVRGSNFVGVHELLDEVVEHAHNYADLAAVSQDVAIEIARALEKDRWFLFAHVSAT